MSYSEPLINQIRVFFLSIGVGAVLCLVYIGVQSFFRLFGKSNRVYYLADGIFCVLFAFISFFFMVLYNSGRVRLHLVLGEAIGFFVFYFAAGKYLQMLLLRLTDVIRKTVGFALMPVRSVCRHFAVGMKEIKTNITVKVSKNKSKEKTEEKNKKKFNFLGEIHLKNKNKSV